LYDGQHKRLFQMINDLHDGIRAKKDLETLVMALNWLEGYTQSHFTDEEKAMLSTGYPGFAHHKGEHAAFIAKIDDFQLRLKNSEREMSEELIEFLVQWLKSHIQTTDRAYGPHLKSKRL
jgi:hemerythrin-like metal-binding protein